MIKLFDIVNYKTGIVGFWKDSQGKIYRDNIKEVDIFNQSQFNKAVNELFIEKKQEAVFYKFNKWAEIINKNGDKIFLKHCITWNKKHLKPSYIKAMIYLHEGLTIYRIDGMFKIEIWKQ
jgi:hypothetical protein